jgi:hypothetical protein
VRIPSFIATALSPAKDAKSGNLLALAVRARRTPWARSARLRVHKKRGPAV